MKRYKIPNLPDTKENRTRARAAVTDCYIRIVCRGKGYGDPLTTDDFSRIEYIYKSICLTLFGKE